MRPILFFMAGFACLIACAVGCTVQTVHSISEAGIVKHDKGLVGDWHHWDPTFQRWDSAFQVSEDRNGYYHIVECDSEKPLRLAGQLVAVGDDCYLELVSEGSESKVFSAIDTSVNTYLFTRVICTGDELTVWTPQHRPLKAAVESGTIQGIVENGRVVITSPANELCNYLKLHEADAFSEPFKLQRIESKNTD